MIYTKFIEPDIGHIWLKEWLKSINSLEHLRVAQTDDPNEWIGYTVNPMSSKGQFHQRPERKYDCDLFFKELNEWKRVFYWHFVEKDTKGVVTYEGAVESKEIESAANELASLIGAKIKDEDTTKYD